MSVVPLKLILYKYAKIDNATYSKIMLKNLSDIYKSINKC